MWIEFVPDSELCVNMLLWHKSQMDIARVCLPLSIMTLEGLVCSQAKTNYGSDLARFNYGIAATMLVFINPCQCISGHWSVTTLVIEKES